MASVKVKSSVEGVVVKQLYIILGPGKTLEETSEKPRPRGRVLLGSTPDIHPTTRDAISVMSSGVTEAREVIKNEQDEG